MEELIEEVGESSSPARSVTSGGRYDTITHNVFNRLLQTDNQQALTKPDAFFDSLNAHFTRLPPSYGLDMKMDKVEDVLLHQRLLEMAKDPTKRPVYHMRFIEYLWAKSEETDEQADDVCAPCASTSFCDTDKDASTSQRNKDSEGEFEACSKLEDLNLDVTDNASGRLNARPLLVHEVIFSTLDKPKLLSELSALLSEIGLNIQEAHVFSTNDGYSLDVFLVHGWECEDTQDLEEALKRAINKFEGSWSGKSQIQSAAEKVLTAEIQAGEWEIDRNLLKIEERVASGACGDLYRGVYLGENVAVKVLRNEHLTNAVENEFAQEISIMREVQHRNVVRFIGACTRAPHLCIVTEYMPGGSLYEYLRSKPSVLNTSQVLRFAMDICKGMEYLHQNNIVHRDLKTVNLLMDNDKVVKVADFGVARFQNQGGIMTAETGTYRWMAPEVMNHQPYDQKADVFSFGIVLWELLTSKVPYDTMSPIQAAVGVRQGLRPELPVDTPPKFADLIKRCWDALPGPRPSFSEILVELEEILQEVENILQGHK